MSPKTKGFLLGVVVGVAVSQIAMKKAALASKS